MPKEIGYLWRLAKAPGGSLAQFTGNRLVVILVLTAIGEQALQTILTRIQLASDLGPV